DGAPRARPRGERPVGVGLTGEIRKELPVEGPEAQAVPPDDVAQDLVGHSCQIVQTRGELVVVVLVHRASPPLRRAISRAVRRSAIMRAGSTHRPDSEAAVTSSSSAAAGTT